MSKVHAGEFPQRPSNRIPDPIWMLLEKCWSRIPTKRPPTFQISEVLLQFQPIAPVAEPPHAESHPMVPIPGDHSKESISGVVQSCVDEIAKVTQPVAFPPSSHHTPILGTRTYESKTKGNRYNRTSRVVPHLWYSSNVIQT